MGVFVAREGRARILTTEEMEAAMQDNPPEPSSRDPEPDSVEVELNALKQCILAFQSCLDPESRNRILEYLSDRFAT